MFDRKWSPALLVLLGTLALTRCSGGGNEVTGLGGGGGNSPLDPATPTPGASPTPHAVPTPQPTFAVVTPAASPTPRALPTPRPCPPRFGDECDQPN